MNRNEKTYIFGKKQTRSAFLLPLRRHKKTALCDALPGTKHARSAFLLPLRRHKKTALFAALLLLFTVILPAAAFDVIPSQDYPFADGSKLPQLLNVYQSLDCGNYAISITNTPTITKSMNGNVADYDFKYLIVRVGITNKTEETIGWVAPDSFSVQEVFRNRIYGTYPMDYLMSAKAAKGYSQNAFYSPIAPGATLSTMVVFDIFPDAESWILNFSPHVFGEESECSVSFMLPKAINQ
ncbi:MAG: hypothetical protein IJI41_09865 [Anaerolineaceae bacterium]|nr:hypothetical protein [Anaerolineaceae bacterium]